MIRESVFMLANDDCLEVSPSSKVQIVDSRFESCYHECLTVHQENSEVRTVVMILIRFRKIMERGQ